MYNTLIINLNSIFKENIMTQDPENLEYFIKELFWDKNVCLIGPATNLVSTNEGQLIDNYDLVCRVNSSYIIADDLIKDYGCRTDVLFSTCNHTVSEAVKNNMKYLQNCKIIINPTDKNHHGKKACDIINKATKGKIPFYQVDDKFVEKNKGLNTGISTILFILTLNVKNLFIAGFDFYTKSNQLEQNYMFDHEKEYKNNPVNLPTVKGKKPLKGNIKSSYWVNYQDTIMKFFERNFIQHPKITFHKNLSSIFSGV